MQEWKHTLGCGILWQPISTSVYILVKSNECCHFCFVPIGSWSHLSQLPLCFLFSVTKKNSRCCTFFWFSNVCFTPLSASLIWGAFINTLKFICILHIISHSDQEKNGFSCVLRSETEMSDFNKCEWMDKISPYFSAFRFNSILTYLPVLCCNYCLTLFTLIQPLTVFENVYE